MEREDLLFRIEYSYNFECMFSRITWRIDKLISLTLLILGSAIFSNISGAFWFGLVIAILTAIQMTYQYAKASEHSSAQSRAYMKLLTTESRLSDDDLLDRLIEIEDGDHKPWFILSDLAIIRTNIRKGYPAECDPHISRFKKCIGWLAGDYPKR